MFEIDLRGKVAWVTGGSRGIGAAICRSLARAGADVAIGYHSQESQAQTVAQEVVAAGRRAHLVQGDMAEGTVCKAGYDQIVKALGPVDILVNSAGVIRDRLFIQLEDEDWAKVMNTNLMGVVHTCKVAVRGMMQKRWGRVINLSSVSATQGGRGQANYAASKAAVEGMTRSLACELGKRNITVNCVAPGIVETDMTQEVISSAGQDLLASQLVKRFAKPDEIAAWVVFLASDYGAYMTGQVLPINGGLKMDL